MKRYVIKSSVALFAMVLILAGSAFLIYAFLTLASSTSQSLVGTAGLSAFLGAFFAFLFVRLGNGMTRIYERSQKHHAEEVPGTPEKSVFKTLQPMKVPKVAGWEGATLVQDRRGGEAWAPDGGRLRRARFLAFRWAPSPARRVSDEVRALRLPFQRCCAHRPGVGSPRLAPGIPFGDPPIPSRSGRSGLTRFRGLRGGAEGRPR
jgi:hypothetical protein